jgi:pimeloyl-ACP methyl ester carboxylesterase
MGYPYWLAWTGGLKAARPFKPQVPMFFGWAKRKPFMFHSQEWADGLNQQPHCKAVGYRAGHWLMLDAAQAFQTDLLQWLQATERV